MSEEKSESVESSGASQQPESGFPVADIKTAGGGIMELLRGSKMWWITIVCLVLAVGLAWQAIPASGTQITIRFDDGHGLKAGDSVQYLGIEVGSVTQVALYGSGVIARVEMKPDTNELLSQKTRFWIVRPQFGLSGVTGLETAVGAKYITLLPGDVAEGVTTEFEGLPAPPVDDSPDEGLQLVLQGDESQGVTPGAPVRWRGIEVGRVLSSGLSADARHVHHNIRIDRMYQRLVRNNSVFWVTSGIRVDAGLFQGLKLNTDSLTTIARGGISFLTPDASDDAPVHTGQIFDLQEEPDQDTKAEFGNVPLYGGGLPQTVRLTGEWDPGIFSRKRTIVRTGILINEGAQTFVLTADLPEGIYEEESRDIDLTLEIPDKDSVVLRGIGKSDCIRSVNGTLRIPLNLKDIAVEKLASAQLPDRQGSLIVRWGARPDGQRVPNPLPVDQRFLSVTEEGWIVSDELGDLEEWSGAPVIAAKSGDIIGVLVVRDDIPIIVAAGTDSGGDGQ